MSTIFLNDVYMDFRRVKLGNEPQNTGNTGKKLKFTGK